jgi:Permuted papain-like amidase enzyme, YaeF/YiiX, C92 family
MRCCLYLSLFRQLVIIQLMFTSTISFGQIYPFKTGDLLFQDVDCGSFCEAIEKVTSSYGGARFSHIGIVAKNKNGDMGVWEAVSAGVVFTPLPKFMSRALDTSGNPKVAWGRVKGLTKSKTKIVIDYCSSKAGKPYDDLFNITNDSYYCSELVYFAFQKAFNKEVFSLEPMTFKDPTTKKTFSIWEGYYKDFAKPIPEGEPGLNPGGISRSKKVKIKKVFYEIKG